MRPSEKVNKAAKPRAQADRYKNRHETGSMMRGIGGRGVFLLVLALVFAACTRPDGPASGPPTAREAEGLAILEEALVNDHDHMDPHEHPLVEWRLDQVFDGNLPLNGKPISPASEFVIHGNLAFVSLFHPSAGIVILDISEPEKPRHVGYFDSGTAYVNDIEVSPDGRWAFLPTSPIKTAENDPLNGGLAIAGDYGIQVADVSNPKDPKLATFWAGPDKDGYHRCDLEVINGQLYVFGASLGYPRIDILRFEPTPVPRLVPVGVYVSDSAREVGKDQASGPNGFGTHDVTVDPDPLQGFPLMAVSHWRSGAHFVDVRDPANPRFLGKWSEFPGVTVGNVHNVEFTKIEGQRVAVVVPEYPQDPKTRGTHWIVNITDFSRPTTLGQWSIPGEHPPGNDPFSSNRVLIRNGTLYVAHFHAGVLVVDIHTLAKAQKPELLGFVVPAGESLVPYSTVRANPYIYDAIPRGDHLFYTDLTGGFHVARMTPDMRSPEATAPAQ